MSKLNARVVFGRLDVLVNNAGTAIPKSFEETTLEELDRLIDVNVRGTPVATQAALKHMKNGGRIIMIGSSVGERVVVPGLVPDLKNGASARKSSEGCCVLAAKKNPGNFWTLAPSE